MNPEFLDQLSPAEHLSETASVVWAIGILPALFIGAALVAAILWWRARSQANTAHMVGARTIVHGRVERDDDAKPPVRLEIVQAGTETPTKNGYTHRWSETTRTLSVRPFYLRTENGDTVRVEPNSQVMLVDGLDETARSGWSRRLVAELTAGEDAFVVGHLERDFDPRMQPNDGTGYRSATSAYVLRPPAGGRMLVSTEPLAARFLRRAKFHGRWALAILLVGVVNQVWFVPFFHRAISGVEVQARITNRRWWTTHSRNGTSYHYAVSAEIMPGQSFDGPLPEDRVSHSDYDALSEGDQVPYLVATDDESAYEIGSHPTTHVGLFIGALIVAIATLGIYYGNTQSTRPWYDRKKLIHTGGVRLDASPVVKNSR